MIVAIYVTDYDKFVVHFKTKNGFTIKGFGDINQADNYRISVIGTNPRIDKLDKYVTLENIIFDYFNYFRGKI